MTALEAYYNLLEKVNRLDSNQNVHVPRGKFVQVYNEQQRNWFKNTQPKDESTDLADGLSELLVDDSQAQLKIKRRHKDNVECDLPSNFFRVANCYVLAGREECTERVIVAFPTKPKNLLIQLRDANQKPSFDFQETLYSVQNDKLKVYFEGFKITSVVMPYYRFPNDIDLEGYIKLDGQPSVSLHPELDDHNVDEILNLCAIEVMRSSQNGEGFNLSATRLPK